MQSRSLPHNTTTTATDRPWRRLGWFRFRPRLTVAFHAVGDVLVVADGTALDIEFHDGDVVAADGSGEVFRAPIESIVTIEVRSR